LIGTVSRAQRMELSQPYSAERVGFLVRDYRRNRFATLETLGGGAGLVIGIPRVNEARDLTATLLPDATTKDFDAIEDQIRDQSVDAILMPVERAHYWSRVHPEFTARRPDDLNIAVITVYAMPEGELELRNLVDLWIETRRASGELDEAYEYWVKGRALAPRAPRWSVVRNVFGWGVR
jgi:ABC-type amino acid transport substrate-binding protein